MCEGGNAWGLGVRTQEKMAKTLDFLVEFEWILSVGATQRAALSRGVLYQGTGFQPCRGIGRKVPALAPVDIARRRWLKAFGLTCVFGPAGSRPYTSPPPGSPHSCGHTPWASGPLPCSPGLRTARAPRFASGRGTRQQVYTIPADECVTSDLGPSAASRRWSKAGNTKCVAGSDQGFAWP